MRRGLLVSLLVVLVLAIAQPSLGASCTTEQKAQRTAAANAYAKRIPAERKAYFKKHKSASQRRAFVAKEKKKLAALRAAAACTVGPPPVPTPPPFTTSTLSISPTVGATQAAIIKRGFDIAEAYFAKIGVPSTWRTTVYVESSVADMAKRDSDAYRYMPEGGGAYARRTGVYIVPAGQSYDSSSDVRHLITPIHEMFHSVQYALDPSNADAQTPESIPPGGPVWLLEGSADDVAYSAVQDAGVDATSFHNEMVSMTKGQFAGVPLQNCQTRADQGRVGYAVYAEGFLAVEHLTSSKGPHSLIDFWSLVGKGTPWPTAFQQVFGTTVEQFYSDFAAYRKTL